MQGRHLVPLRQSFDRETDEGLPALPTPLFAFQLEQASGIVIVAHGAESPLPLRQASTVIAHPVKGPYGCQEGRWQRADCVPVDPEAGTSNSVGALDFVGFTDAGKSITSVTINAGSHTLGWDDIGVDDVQFGPAAAGPEPASLAIFGTALAGLGAIRRRRKRV
jgi:hypothetical protein